MSETLQASTRVKHEMQGAHSRPVSRRQAPSLQPATGLSEMSGVSVKIMANQSRTDWALLRNGQMFSTSPDGSSPCVKVSRSKAWNLLTSQSFPVGGGQCYPLVMVAA